MPRKDEIRARNPFSDPLVSELIETPQRYRKMFSERILVGETLQVFQPTNVVLVGPQGSGKTMILNLVRYSVIQEWLSESGKPPAPLQSIEPFAGISVNLVRANFHAFGRRSVAKAMRISDEDHLLDASCAADFLINYLFREFLRFLKVVFHPDGATFRRWLGLSLRPGGEAEVARVIRDFRSWQGYYSECDSLDALLNRVEQRLSSWLEFLNGNTDVIEQDVWRSKATLEGPLHEIGNLLSHLRGGRHLPLFVVIDQYEVLPELNSRYGTTLQRVINTLIKLRDPVVFYKIGARTYDWGRELRIWGADSRIEVQRDYTTINLADLLMRSEESAWLFPEFARDVAHKRLLEGGYKASQQRIARMLGKWTAEDESQFYRKRTLPGAKALGPVSVPFRRRLLALVDKKSPLELRLAGAWAIQKLQRRTAADAFWKEAAKRPWKTHEWWRKERVGVALHQLASMANQKRRYFGWYTVLYLSGANVSAFLLICSQIWDMAVKMELDPSRETSIDPVVQTEAIYLASERWAIRDKNESFGGSQRFAAVSRLGPAIREALLNDLAISNPGHTGFSLRESDLTNDETGLEVARFLERAVSWAIFEERPHTSKERNDAERRKWYLHPLLSPRFGIPHIRVKEPAYVTANDVHEWLFGKGRIRFPKQHGNAIEHPESQGAQLVLPLNTSR